jgi:hypothetical protein
MRQDDQGRDKVLGAACTEVKSDDCTISLAGGCRIPVLNGTG